MIAGIIIPFAVGCLIMVAAEFMRRKLGYGNEVSRKIVHFMHGLCLTVWAFTAPHWFIFYFEAFFFIFMFIARYAAHRWPQVNWLYQVERQTWGEFFYPLGILALLLLTQDEWRIAVSVLILALADSLAAVIGKAYGRSTEYKVFKTTKSLVGTATFALTALVCLLVVLLPSGEIHGGLAISLFIWLPLILAAIENAGAYGSDNLLIPVACVLLLNLAL